MLRHATILHAGGAGRRELSAHTLIAALRGQICGSCVGVRAHALCAYLAVGRDRWDTPEADAGAEHCCVCGFVAGLLGAMSAYALLHADSNSVDREESDRKGIFGKSCHT